MLRFPLGACAYVLLPGEMLDGILIVLRGLRVRDCIQSSDDALLSAADGGQSRKPYRSSAALGASLKEKALGWNSFYPLCVCNFNVSKQAKCSWLLSLMGSGHFLMVQY